MDIINYIGAGLAVGLAGIGVAIGQGFLAKASVEVIGKRKEMTSFLLTVTILGIALVESAAIYGLIVAFQLIGTEAMTLNAAIGAGLAIGLAGAGAGIGEGILVAGAIKGIDENPKMKMKLMTFMVLFVALVESAAIYGLVISMQILGSAPFESQSYIGMGLSIGLAALGVAIGHGLLARKTMEAMAQRSEMAGFLLTVTILGIALVESAAIYGLVVALSIVGKTLPLYASIGAGVAIGLTGLGAGIGEGILVSGAISAIVRNPSQKTKIITFMVLFVALAEVTAIYGLIVAYGIINIENIVDSTKFLGAGFAVGLAGLGVAIGIGFLAQESLKIMGKNPNMIKFLLTISILGVALLESAVIYGLVVSFQILGKETIDGMIAFGSGLAIGLAGLGAGLGEGLIVKGAMEGMNKAPESKGKTLAFMVLFVALVEVVAIYGLIIAMQGLYK
ncbi:hypothetical protein DLH72_03680 [Candidatus Gracilibacteria bacterium]|nr:MAG: hypothetical protein DLH72_03680 [Candidatus Gracilibacteria bacterium]